MASARQSNPMVAVQGVNFIAHSRAIEEAWGRDMPEPLKRQWRVFMSDLQRVFEEFQGASSVVGVTQATRRRTQSATQNQTGVTSFARGAIVMAPINTTTGSNGNGNGSAARGNQVRYRTTSAGDDITPGSTIHIDADGQAWLATAADVDRFCDGVCTAVSKSQIGLTSIEYTCFESGVIGLLAAPISAGRQLYLSVTPGKLTDLSNESPGTKLFHQELALWQQYQSDSFGDINQVASIVDFKRIPPDSMP